jgi:hypothetical protein
MDYDSEGEVISSGRKTGKRNGDPVKDANRDEGFWPRTSRIADFRIFVTQDVLAWRKMLYLPMSCRFYDFRIDLRKSRLLIGRRDGIPNAVRDFGSGQGAKEGGYPCGL